jgi:hypothetical protein
LRNPTGNNINKLNQKIENWKNYSVFLVALLSRGEVPLVIDELQDTIKNYLLDGYTVQMGDWENFLLTSNCEEAELRQAAN